jgi:hypothetical protein
MYNGILNGIVVDITIYPSVSSNMAGRSSQLAMVLWLSGHVNSPKSDVL